MVHDACNSLKQTGTMAASRLMGVRSEAVNQGEPVMVRTEESSPSPVKSSLVQQCTLLKFAVEKERPTKD